MGEKRKTTYTCSSTKWRRSTPHLFNSTGAKKIFFQNYEKLFSIIISNYYLLLLLLLLVDKISKRRHIRILLLTFMGQNCINKTDK